MRIIIDKIERATAEMWDKIWQNCPYATYFHSREWAEIWNVYSKGKYYPEPRMIFFSDGKKAIIPLSCSGRHCLYLIKSYISSPAWTYGGWLSCDQLEIEHVKLLDEYMRTQCGDLYWMVNPFDKDILKFGIIKPEGLESSVVDLSIGFENVCKNYSRSNMKAVRQAQKFNVTVREASTLQDWKEYFVIYEDCLIRWKKKNTDPDVYKWELFEEIRNRRSSYIRLWLAIYEDKIISGVLCFYAKEHVVLWHSATLKDFYCYRPVNFLYYSLIKIIYDQGYHWFDFNPTGELKGASDFKKSFGTQPMSCPQIYIETKATKLYKKIFSVKN